MTQNVRWFGALVAVLAAATALPTSNAAFTAQVASVDNSWTSRQQFTATGVDLRSAAAYSVLAWTDVSNSGNTVLNDALGVSPGVTVTGFPPGIAGSIHVADDAATQAQRDLTAAYRATQALTATRGFSGDQNAITFSPGVYFTGAAFALTGTMTLDAGGDPNASFIFQIDAAMNTAASSKMVLAHGARAANVFFQVAGAAGAGALSSMVGTVMAQGAITAGAGAHVNGRLLSLGKVTLSSNTITTP